MTEDDTFNALRKTPILEMISKVSEINSKYAGRDYDWDSLFRCNGWTRREYNEQLFIHFNEYYEKTLNERR
jgi:hypothetical protein